MIYLRVCDADDFNEIRAHALQRIARTFKHYAQLTERWEFVEPHQTNYERGQSRLHCEYDTIYLRIGDVQMATYMAGMAEFEGSWRRPEHVRIFASI